MLPISCVELLNSPPNIETKAYIKPTNTGQSPSLSQPSRVFVQTCSVNHHVTPSVQTFIHLVLLFRGVWPSQESILSIYIPLDFDRVRYHTLPQFQDLNPTSSRITRRDYNNFPFEYQLSAEIVKKRLSSPGLKIGHVIQSVFTSCKVYEDIKIREVLKTFCCESEMVRCHLCYTGYVDFTHVGICTSGLRNTW